MAAIISTLLWLGSNAVSQAEDISSEVPQHYAEQGWQSASLDDMQMLSPYIGTFRGASHTNAKHETFYFTVTNEWYDDHQTIVHYILKIHYPKLDEVALLGEGFYRYDGVNQRIAVTGVFKDGRSTSGFVTPFDRTTGSREVRFQSKRPGGKIYQVRDTFNLVDQNHWRNRTFMSQAGEPWRLVSEEIYSRVSRR